VASIRELIHTEEQLRHEEEHARRSGQLTRAAELTYRVLPDVSGRIEELEATLRASQAAGLLLRDVVTARDIAEIAARWTGKPIAELEG
jgi:ATP-dependent Clp protease ATP-binding subunit ClpB